MAERSALILFTPMLAWPKLSVMVAVKTMLLVFLKIAVPPKVVLVKVMLLMAGTTVSPTRLKSVLSVWLLALSVARAPVV